MTDPQADDPQGEVPGDPRGGAQDDPPDEARGGPKGLDPGALAGYLADCGVPGLSVTPPLTAALLPGGKSNLTYRVRDAAGGCWVLRRPPLGHVLPTAHDMGREYRVTAALRGVVPVAAPLLHCPDRTVIGAPFYLMEHVTGTVLRSREQCAALTPAEARRTCEALVDLLVTLHAVRPADIGLADLGHPDGYLDRQLDRWGRQYAASQSREVVGLFELAEGLRAAVPVTQRGVLLHGDYQLANVMFATGRGAPVAAVLDWEMATLGDPLADLGLLLTHWTAPNRRGGLTGHPGFLSPREIVDRYAGATGLIVDDLDWYVALGHYKLAVIIEQIHYRHQRGLTHGSGFEEFEAGEGAESAVAALVESGRRHLERMM